MEHDGWGVKLPVPAALQRWPPAESMEPRFFVSQMEFPPIHLLGRATHSDE